MVAVRTWVHRSPRPTWMRLARSEHLLLAATILAGFALRLPLLDRFPLHQDEAIYGFWALYGRHVDPLFLHIWPDKPPIFLWLLGGSFDLFGATPGASRLLNIAVSTLTIACVGALARTWWGARAGIFAALLLALNPFAISFAPTAFTDPLMVLGGLLALGAVARRRFFWAGLWLGIALMTKQQGVLFAPLLLAIALAAPRARDSLARSASWFVAGLLLVIVPVIYWDSLRWAVAPSPWDLGAHNAAGLALSPPALWAERLHGWAGLGNYLLGSPAHWVLAAGAALVLWSTRRSAVVSLAQRPALVLALWSIAFFLLHVVTTVSVWDRYLLPLAAPVALLAAFMIEAALARRNKVYAWLPPALLALWLLLLSGPAMQAAQGALPIGGDHGGYGGLARVSTWLDAQKDGSPIVYHRTLGWHLSFYLFAPVQEGSVDLRWYPSAVYLADNAAKTPHRPRYLVTADWSPERDLAVQLAARRLIAHQRLRTGHFTVYEIAEAPAPAAAWRVCTQALQLIYPLLESSAVHAPYEPATCTVEDQP